MRTAQIALRLVGAFTILAFMIVGVGGCATTTSSHRTVIVNSTPAQSTPAPTSPTPLPGIWCLVKQGQMPLVSACEIFPSEPQVYTPPQSGTILAGTYVGPGIGSGSSSTVTEHLQSPWAADVTCATSDNSNTGKVRITMAAHTSSGDFYSWGDQSCGPPEAPGFGQEYFRNATVTVTLSIIALTSNLANWQAQLIQL